MEPQNSFEEINNISDPRRLNVSITSLLRGNAFEDNNRSIAVEFLKLLCSEELYKSSLDLIGVDTSKINLETHLSHQNIQLAVASLRNIKHILQSNTDDGVELLLQNYNFYKSIPHKRSPTRPQTPPYTNVSSMEHPEIVCSTDQLECKMRLLQSFISISFAMSMIRAVKAQISAEERLCWTVLSEIGCSLVPADRTSMEYDLLVRYFEASNIGKRNKFIDVFHVENEYAIQPPKGSLSDLDAPERMWILLWRACPLYKILATLRHGLDDTSWNDSSDTCQAFRLFDMASPCVEFQTYNKCALLLYEVFLGIPLESHLIQKTISAQYDSLVVRGTVGPDPGGATLLPARILSYQMGQ